MLNLQQVASAIACMPASVQSALLDGLGADLVVPLIQQMSRTSPDYAADEACQQLLATLLCEHPQVLEPTLRRLLTQVEVAQPGLEAPVLLSQAFPEHAQTLAGLTNTELLKQLSMRADQLRREFTNSLKTRFLLDFPCESEPADLLAWFLQNHPQLVGGTLRDYLHDKSRHLVGRRLQQLKVALANCTPGAATGLEEKLEKQFPGLFQGLPAEKSEPVNTLKLFSRFLGAYPLACLALVSSDSEVKFCDCLASSKLAPQWIDFILDHKHW